MSRVKKQKDVYRLVLRIEGASPKTKKDYYTVAFAPVSLKRAVAQQSAACKTVRENF